MSDEESTGAQLDSLDDIEDALVCLRRSGFNFVLIVGTHETGSSFYSHLTEFGQVVIRDWIKDNRLNKYVLDHVDSCYPQEGE